MGTSKIERLDSIVREEFGGWGAYFRRQGFLHGIVWAWYEMRQS